MLYYLVCEDVKYQNKQGLFEKAIRVYGKGCQTLKAAKLKEIPISKLTQTAVTNACTMEEAFRYFISPHRMWRYEQGAEAFKEKHITEAHNLYVREIKVN